MTLHLRKSPYYSADNQEYDVYSGEMRWGRIQRQVAADTVVRWSWVISAIYMGREHLGGSADTMEQAMEDCGARWRAWLDKANLMEKEKPPA